MYEKLTKCQNFTRFLPEKMPEFHIIIAQKNFPDFSFFLGGGGMCPPCPPSPTPIYQKVKVQGHGVQATVL